MAIKSGEYTIGGHKYRITQPEQVDAGIGGLFTTPYPTVEEYINGNWTNANLIGGGNKALHAAAAIEDPRFMQWISQDDPNTQTDNLVREVFKRDPAEALRLYGQQTARKSGGVDQGVDSNWFSDENYWPNIYGAAGTGADKELLNDTYSVAQSLGLVTPDNVQKNKQWSQDMSPGAQHDRNDPDAWYEGAGGIILAAAALYFGMPYLTEALASAGSATGAVMTEAEITEAISAATAGNFEAANAVLSGAGIDGSALATSLTEAGIPQEALSQAVSTTASEYGISPATWEAFGGAPANVMPTANAFGASAAPIGTGISTAGTSLTGSSLAAAGIPTLETLTGASGLGLGLTDSLISGAGNSEIWNSLSNLMQQKGPGAVAQLLSGSGLASTAINGILNNLLKNSARDDMNQVWDTVTNGITNANKLRDLADPARAMLSDQSFLNSAKSGITGLQDMFDNPENYAGYGAATTANTAAQNFINDPMSDPGVRAALQIGAENTARKSSSGRGLNSGSFMAEQNAANLANLANLRQETLGAYGTTANAGMNQFNGLADIGAKGVNAAISGANANTAQGIGAANAANAHLAALGTAANSFVSPMINAQLNTDPTRNNLQGIVGGGVNWSPVVNSGLDWLSRNVFGGNS